MHARRISSDGAPSRGRDHRPVSPRLAAFSIGLAAVCSTLCASGCAEPTPPNVILISIDGLRPERIQVLQHGPAAAQGVLYGVLINNANRVNGRGEAQSGIAL